MIKTRRFKVPHFLKGDCCKALEWMSGHFHFESRHFDLAVINNNHRWSLTGSVTCESERSIAIIRQYNKKKNYKQPTSLITCCQRRQNHVGFQTTLALDL